MQSMQRRLDMLRVELRKRCRAGSGPVIRVRHVNSAAARCVAVARRRILLGATWAQGRGKQNGASSAVRMVHTDPARPPGAPIEQAKAMSRPLPRRGTCSVLQQQLRLRCQPPSRAWQFPEDVGSLEAAVADGSSALD